MYRNQRTLHRRALPYLAAFRYALYVLLRGNVTPKAAVTKSKKFRAWLETALTNANGDQHDVVSCIAQISDNGFTAWYMELATEHQQDIGEAASMGKKRKKDGDDDDDDENEQPRSQKKKSRVIAPARGRGRGRGRAQGEGRGASGLTLDGPFENDQEEDEVMEDVEI
ncbi:hypothetical protein LTR95_006326 [Oleoguttula sp. CCFEE 5521]